MAGMLPGVETARRRRMHQSAAEGTSSRYFSSSSTSFGDFSHFSMRRSSIPLYSTNHESLNLPFMQLNPIQPAYADEKLDKAAREAKERLDQRLKALRKCDTKRAPNRRQQTSNLEGTRPIVRENEETEIVGLKQSGSKRFDLAKLSWKSLEQEECAVCLEQFKNGETLMHLACAHRFHSRCLMSWLDTNARCPCCRMIISIE
ncbi:ubiquitin-protein ligase [Lithospermum erythrorhizon]|uniref:RING-type E3 ubiquitin transferase n=1 Tax=Lithospermum erythrorhizon TaxID=34254 RepID=A0AAV3QV98_LITER